VLLTILPSAIYRVFKNPGHTFRNGFLGIRRSDTSKSNCENLRTEILGLGKQICNLKFIE
jgi:hypothetical protein